jgi:uncharacterized protein (TIGR02284 family)
VQEDIMAEWTERSVLNHLIETCKDGERGFRYAANHVTNPTVKALFLKIASEREGFATDLLPHAQRLGGPSDADGTTAGALHRGWITLKDALTGHDERAVIGEAERGEGAAEAVYKDAVEGMLPPTVRDVVQRQYEQVCESHARVRAFLNA